MNAKKVEIVPKESFVDPKAAKKSVCNLATALLWAAMRRTKQFRQLARKMRQERNKKNPTHQFRDRRMTAGVQRSLERRQRPARMAWIAESQRQGEEVAAQQRRMVESGQRRAEGRI